MNFTKEGFEKWKPFKMRKIDIGYVYIIKSTNKKIKRKNGESYIVKIGSTNNINRRLYEYLEPNRIVEDKDGNPKVSRKTAKNVRDAINSFGELVISCVKTSNYKKMEDELSKEFQKEYGEKPEAPTN